MKKLLGTGAAFAVAIGLGMTGFGGTAEASSHVYISIGTGGPTGVYFAAGNAICRLIDKEAAEGRKKGQKNGLRCSAPSTGGSNYNIGQIMSGDLDFGIAQSDWQYHAYHGDAGPWKKRGPQKKLRAVFSIHPEPFQIIVGKDSGIHTWADLKGKRVNIGNPGSGQRGTMEVLMAAHHTKASDFKAATELTSTEQSKALCDGKIDAFGYSVGFPNAGVAVATDGCGARLINLDGPVEQKLVAANPFYAFATMPAGTYKTMTKPITTFGVRATFLTSADEPTEVVYKVVRAVFANIDEFRKLHPAFKNLDPKKMIKVGLSAPLHPGAIKYYKERGWLK